MYGEGKFYWIYITSQLKYMTSFNTTGFDEVFTNQSLVCFKSNFSRNIIGTQKHFGFDHPFSHKLQTAIIEAYPVAGFSRRKN